MPWSASKTISSMEGKSSKLKELFAKVANAALAKGQTEEEAIFAGLGAVKLEEKKHRVAKVVQPKVPAHLQVLRDLPLVKAVEPTPVSAPAGPTVKSVEFDAQGHLVLLMSDNTTIKTKGKAVEEHINQSVGVSVNPVFDYVQLNTTANLTDEDFLAGMLTWNETEDCLDVVQGDGSRLQVGLEGYIIVSNQTENTLPNGCVVRFAGIADTDSPTVLPMISGDTVEPLHLVGVLTNNIEAGKMGRATVFGKVRNLNTTGSEVNETWTVGDLLWVHPTIAGKLTKNRPTAPVSAISVATVVRVGVTNGAILVRPTIFPHLSYGSFSSNITQTPVAINTPRAVTYQDTEFSHGVELANSSHIVARNAGLFSFDFRLQVVSSNSSAKVIYIWARKNGVDIPNSTTRISFSGNSTELAPSWSFTESMLENDYFELMYAVSDVAVSINAPAATSFCPATPSATMRVTQLNL